MIGQRTIPDGGVFGLMQSKFPDGLRFIPGLTQRASQGWGELRIDKELHAGCKMAWLAWADAYCRQARMSPVSRSG